MGKTHASRQDRADPVTDQRVTKGKSGSNPPFMPGNAALDDTSQRRALQTIREMIGKGNGDGWIALRRGMTCSLQSKRLRDGQRQVMTTPLIKQTAGKRLAIWVRMTWHLITHRPRVRCMHAGILRYRRILQPRTLRCQRRSKALQRQQCNEQNKDKPSDHAVRIGQLCCQINGEGCSRRLLDFTLRDIAGIYWHH